MEKIEIGKNWNIEVKDVYHNERVKENDSFSSKEKPNLNLILFENGLKNDIFEECEEWVFKSSWLFSTSFSLEKTDSHYAICIPMLSANAVLSVNEKEIGMIESGKDNNYFDITSELKSGINNLSLFFPSLKFRDKDLNLNESKNQQKAPAICEKIMLLKVDTFYTFNESLYTTKENDKWIIHYEFDSYSYEKTTEAFSISFTKGTFSDKVNIKKGLSTTSLSFTLEEKDIEIWWPNGAGKQSLYPTKIKLGENESEKILAFKDIKINFENGKNILYVNQEKVFIKGSIWKTNDPLISFNPLSYQNLLESASKMKINTLKVIGIGSSLFEDKAFYEEASRLGILIFQTIKSAKNLKNSIKKIKDQPCLALWFLEEDKNLNEDEEKEIEKIIKNEDKTHILLKEKESTFSSISLPSLPSPSSLSLYVSKEELNLSSPKVEKLYENKNGSCEIVSEIAKNFIFPHKIDTMRYLSQLSQVLGTEKRVNKARCRENSGVFFYFLADTKPSISASSIEYSGKWKLLSYDVRRFYSSLTPILLINEESNEIEVYVINDKREDQNVELKVKFRYFNGAKKDTKYFEGIAKKQNSTKLGKISLSNLDRKNLFCYAHLESGELIRERTFLLLKPKEVNLEKPKIKVELNQLDKRSINIRLLTDKPAFYVALENDKVKGTFSDNLIALRSSTEKNIIFSSQNEIKLEDFEKDLKVFDLYSSRL